MLTWKRWKIMICKKCDKKYVRLKYVYSKPVALVFSSKEIFSNELQFHKNFQNQTNYSSLECFCSNFQ